MKQKKGGFVKDLIKKKYWLVGVIGVVLLVFLGLGIKNKKQNKFNQVSTTKKAKTLKQEKTTQLPNDIPIMSDAKVLFVAGKGSNKTISCQATKQEIKKDEVFSFYKTELVKQGWTITKEELYALKATKGDKKLRVVPAMTNKDGLLIFNIAIETD